MSNSRSIRGPEDVDPEIRDEMCGAVARAVLAETGRSCVRRGVEEIADQLDEINGVRVDRWEPAETQADDRDFLDITIEAGARHSRVLLICQRNGFSPEAIAGSWERVERDVEDTTLVMQWKR